MVEQTKTHQSGCKRAIERIEQLEEELADCCEKLAHTEVQFTRYRHGAESSEAEWCQRVNELREKLADMPLDVGTEQQQNKLHEEDKYDDLDMAHLTTGVEYWSQKATRLEAELAAMRDTARSYNTTLAGCQEKLGRLERKLAAAEAREGELRDVCNKAMEWAAGFPLGGEMDAIAAHDVYSVCHILRPQPDHTALDTALEARTIAVLDFVRHSIADGGDVSRDKWTEPMLDALGETLETIDAKIEESEWEWLSQIAEHLGVELAMTDATYPMETVLAVIDAALEQAYENGKEYEHDAMLMDMECGHPLAVSEETAGGDCAWCESLEQARAEGALRMWKDCALALDAVQFPENASLGGVWAACSRAIQALEPSKVKGANDAQD